LKAVKNVTDGKDVAMNKFVAIMLSVLLAAGCGGETGPTGPQGPQGDTGPPGPAGTAMVMVTGTLDAGGGAVVHLPAVAGTIDNPPLVTCYLAEFATDQVWLVMATDDIFGSCGILADGLHVDVGFVLGPPSWALRVIAVYTP
jgi:hypothetical protein